MYHYKGIEWLFFFYIYCMIGWVVESTYVSVKTRKVTNRGFMRGPWLPIYGSGAIVMLFCASPFRDNILLLFISGMFGASLLEFLTGMAMEALFKVRYWDYSNRKFNIMGHVCLCNSIYWGIFTVLLNMFIHVPVARMVSEIPFGILRIITFILSVVIGVDFILAFKTAIDIRNVLVQMSRAKEEMVRIQKRMDVLIAVTADGLGNKKDQVTQMAGNVMDTLEETFGKAKRMITGPASTLTEAAGNEIFELRDKFLNIKAKITGYYHSKDINFIGAIKGNPDMVSKDYAEALEALKKNI